MCTVKALQRSYTALLTLSRQFPLKKTFVKRIYWLLWSLQEMNIITMTIMCICTKKANWLWYPFLSRWYILYNKHCFSIWWHSSYSIHTSIEDLCQQQFYWEYSSNKYLNSISWDSKMFLSLQFYLQSIPPSLWLKLMTKGALRSRLCIQMICIFQQCS